MLIVMEATATEKMVEEVLNSLNLENQKPVDWNDDQLKQVATELRKMVIWVEELHPQEEPSMSRWFSPQINSHP